MPQVNKWAKNARENIRRRQMAQIQDHNGRLAIQDRLGTLIFITKAILAVLILWSIITETAFLYTEFLKFSSSIAIAVALTLIVVAVLETIKLTAGPLWIRFMTHGWLRENRYYLIFFLLLSLIALIGFGGSATFSIWGGPTTAKNIKNLTSTLPLIDLDSIHQRYDGLIQSERTIQADARNMTWKNRITRKGQQLMNQTQETINQHEIMRSQEIAAAIAENDRIRRENTADIDQFGGWLQALGGIPEGITLLLLLLLSLFYRAVSDEQDPDGQEDETPQLRKLVSDDLRQPPKRSIQDILNDGIPTLPRGLADSGQTLSEQQRTVPSDPIVLTDNRVIEHTSENGKVKLYKHADVLGMISKYEGRIQRLEQRIVAGKATAKTHKALLNNQNWLAYWQQRLREFPRRHRPFGRTGHFEQHTTQTMRPISQDRGSLFINAVPMIPEVIYQQAEDRILEVLKDMFKSLEQYRRKEDHNANWLQTQEERLAAVGLYVKEVRQILEIFQQERDEAYRRGFRRGKESEERPRFRQQYNPFDIHPDVVKGMLQKESIRRYNNAQARQLWADHY